MNKLKFLLLITLLFKGTISFPQNMNTSFLNNGVKMENLKTIESKDNGITIKTISTKIYKSKTNANPLIANVFCADPTAIEYEGRLYVYGTNDHQQFLTVGKSGKNTYEHIKSLVMLSTDDMVNWTYHGIIDIAKIAPFAYASWAPSITSRLEKDGKTHFYLYYSNSGAGVGVLTATSPTGPWTDPLGHSLVDKNSKGIGDCEAPFDPGVLIDNEGTGWLTFGGGSPNKSKGTDYQPGNSRIVKLGKDMISLDSNIIELDTPYHFEANELNFINDTYVYTYNTNWVPRNEWHFSNHPKPPACSMVYMTSKNPLLAESWKYQGAYFKNPGEFQMEYSNNHTHLHKYNGKYYLFYHSLFPQKAFGTNGGFRSLCVDEIHVDEETLSIRMKDGSRKGVSQIKTLDPYVQTKASTMATSSQISYNQTSFCNTTVSGLKSGAWIMVRGVDFNDNATSLLASVKGTGCIDVYVDNFLNTKVASIQFENQNEFVNVHTQLLKTIKDTHNIFFVLSGKDMEFASWKFSK